MTAVVTAIHNTPEKVVLEFAGAGSLALAWLHRVGGSSRTILEATDRYAAASLTGLIGFQPEQFVSRGVAVAMAAAAYQRAQTLAEPETPLLGIGCTATIATDRTKRGQHRACVAAYSAASLLTFDLTLTKGARDRLAEEQLVSRLIVRAIAQASGLANALSVDLIESETIETSFQPVTLLNQLLAGSVQTVTLSPTGRLAADEPITTSAILSGSFNPLHQGHRQMAQIAAQTLGRPVYFELPLLNADKPALAPAEAIRRSGQFLDYAPLVFSGAPLFTQKARIFPNTVFIVGYDTAVRLIEPRFYHDDPAEMQAAFAAIRAAGCRFFVAGRLKDDRFLTWRDLALPDDLRDLFDGFTEQEFRLDLSSTELRQKQG
ncbi:MAG: hypothetical protein H6631_09235 [Anaerolineaceae bacterium]|nr:hypothetical protein [Anaerolineaceae bacterium]MCB9101861.1 hypothetical protein [Anaerolineales bacterium]